MNIEAFNTDTLRKLVRNLQDENKKLKEKLDEANIPYEEINLFEQPINKSAEYDPDHFNITPSTRYGILSFNSRSKTFLT